MRKMIWALVAASTLLMACPSSSPVGKSYGTVAAATSSPEFSGWNLMGKFGPEGPFTVKAVQAFASGEKCTFTHDRSSHSYPAKPGATYKVVTLANKGGKETTLVLRK